MVLPHTAGAPLAANPTDGSFEAYTLAGPSWDLASEYRGPESAELTADLRELSGLLDQIEALNPTLIDALPGAASLSLAASGASLAVAQQVARLAERAGPLLSPTFRTPPGKKYIKLRCINYVTLETGIERGLSL